ncbi:hypothetical protein E2C01_055710 [Portunus trituberculatus]|uniref:Uncharacterized protein n=1 Tax=Portunus trituberculatus TaxID=210409 RepID=A0A5B7GWA6_PORTR|nr:hypothetical protein [Portunus trituberculatus]
MSTATCPASPRHLIATFAGFTSTSRLNKGRPARLSPATARSCGTKSRSRQEKDKAEQAGRVVGVVRVQGGCEGAGCSHGAPREGPVWAVCMARLKVPHNACYLRLDLQGWDKNLIQPPASTSSRFVGRGTPAAGKETF